MAIETRIADITPRIALGWLESNEINRRLRPGEVENWKRLFARGEYLMTHQGIAFSASGRLLDGQHRLTAISEMPPSFSVKMLVTAGLPDPAFMVMDKGMVRTHADTLGIGTGIAATARYLATLRDTDKRGKLTTAQIVPYVHGIEGVFNELLSFCSACSKTWSSSAVRAAAVIQLLNGVDPDYAKLTYYALNHAEFDSMSPIAQALFRQHLTGSANTRGTDMFCRAFKTFDRRNYRTTKLQINDTSSIVSVAREIIDTKILGVGSARTKEKAPTSGAKKVNTPNSTKSLVFA